MSERDGTIATVSTLVRLRGSAGTRLDEAGAREWVELSGSGEDYATAYADLGHQVPQAWLLLHVRREDAAETF